MNTKGHDTLKQVFNEPLSPVPDGVICAIADHYGPTVQKGKLVEEMAELTQAIMKDDIESIIEELVDVEILVQQLHHLLIGDDDVMNRLYAKTKEMKVARQLTRIAGAIGDEIC